MYSGPLLSSLLNWSEAVPFSSLSGKGVSVGGHVPSPGDDDHMPWFCMNSGTVCVECEEGLQHPSRAQPLGNPGPSETEQYL